MATDDGLADEITAHQPCCSGSAGHRPYCRRCHESWPCRVRRPADDLVGAEPGDRDAEIIAAARAAIAGLITAQVCAHADDGFSGNADEHRPNDCSVCAAIGPLARLLDGEPRP